MSGYSRTEMRCRQTIPKMISIRLMTVAKTGRRIETSAIRMAALPSGRLRQGRRGDRGASVGAHFEDLAAIAHFLRAFDDDAFAARRPSVTCTEPGLRRPSQHFALGRRCRHFTTNTKLLPCSGDDGAFRHEQRTSGRRLILAVMNMPGLQDALRDSAARRDDDGARDRVYAPSRASPPCR